MSAPRTPKNPRTLHTELHLEVWKPGFTAELAALIHKHGIEAEAKFPATLLANYFLACLNTLESMHTQLRSYEQTGWRPGPVPTEEGRGA